MHGPHVPWSIPIELLHRFRSQQAFNSDPFEQRSRSALQLIPGGNLHSLDPVGIDNVASHRLEGAFYLEIKIWSRPHRVRKFLFGIFRIFRRPLFQRMGWTYDYRTRSRRKSPHTPHLTAGLESLAVSGFSHGCPCRLGWCGVSACLSHNAEAVVTVACCVPR